MGKKILLINGSPRPKGNTTLVLEWVATGLQRYTDAIDTVRIGRVSNTAHGCLGCRKCNRTDDYTCALDDEISDLILTILRRDVVVFATPVYFGSFSAQMKQLIDRLYCLKCYRENTFTIHPALKPVRFALVATAGADASGGLHFLSQHMRAIAAGFEKEPMELLVPLCPPDPRKTALLDNIRRRAVSFGEAIARP